MKPISINLASRPFYNTRVYLVAFAASVALLLIMTILNLVTLFQGQAAWKRFGEDQAGLQSKLRSLDHDAPDVAARAAAPRSDGGGRAEQVCQCRHRASHVQLDADVQPAGADHAAYREVAITAAQGGRGWYPISA